MSLSSFEMFTDARPNTNSELLFKPKLTKTDLMAGLNSLDTAAIFEFSLLYFPSVSDDIDLMWLPDQNVTREQVFSGVRQMFNEDLFIEVLYYMKKFKLLKTFGLCQHRVKYLLTTGEKQVKQLWKTLYDVMQDMNDDELGDLIQRIVIANEKNFGIPRGYRNWLPEQFFLRAYMHKLFTESRLFPIYNSLSEVGRTDLADKLKSHEAASQFYRVMKGYVWIINQINFEKTSPPVNEGEETLGDRNGAKVDEEALIKLFEDFGYHTFSQCDLGSQQIVSSAKALANWNGINHYDIVIVCILSHGESGCVYGIDHVPVALKDLGKIFGTSPQLTGKPKLFLVQACQGTRKLAARSPPPKNNHHPIGMGTDGLKMPSLVPDIADMLYAMSTIDGHVSYRSATRGSPFIQCLVENLAFHGHTEDIQFIMTRVINDVSEFNQRLYPNMIKYIQLPAFGSTLRKKLIMKLSSS